MISTQKKSQPSASKRFFSASIIKPVVASSTIMLIDRFYFKNNDLRSNLYFAGCVGAGTFVSSSIAESTKGLSPTNTMVGSLKKNLESRIIEIACVTGVSYATNRFLLKNEYNSRDMYQKLGAIAIGDLVSEAVSEFVLKMM